METPAWVLLAGTRAFFLVLVVPLLVRGVPASVRAGLALVIAAGLLPAALASMAPAPPEALAPLFLREAACGLALAVVAGAAVWAAEVAGRLSDAARRGPRPSAPLGEAFGLGAVVLLLGAGAHRLLLRVAAAGYQVFPPDRAVTLDGGWLDAVLVGSGAVIATGVAVAVPALAVSLAVHAAGAVGRRTGPWLSGRLGAMSAASLAVVGVSALVAGFLSSGLEVAFREGLTTAGALLRALGG